MQSVSAPRRRALVAAAVLAVLACSLPWCPRRVRAGPARCCRRASRPPRRRPRAPAMRRRYATDGNAGTRWGRLFTDPQWLRRSTSAPPPRSARSC